MAQYLVKLGKSTLSNQMIIALGIDEFYDKYRDDVGRVNSANRKLREWAIKISSMQKLLSDKLSDAGWNEFDDFNVEKDLDERYFVCGMISNENMLSSELIEIVLMCFKEDESSDLWMCHFAVERPGVEGVEEFFIRGNGEVVVCHEGNSTSELAILLDR